MLVTVIDFGTAFFGYAFSFLRDLKKTLKISAISCTEGVGNLVSFKSSVDVRSL